MKKLLLAILWLLTILMPSVSWAQSSEPYAVLSNDVSGGKILTFYYDDQRVAREGMLIVPFDAADRPWNEQREDITSVVFDDSFGSCTTLTSTADWFWYCHNLRSITGISNLKTDNVTNMSGMFYGCRSLTSLDVSGFKTQNVTDMSWMFYECHEVTTLDVTQFDTHNVTDMSYLFCDCKKLTTLDVSGFNTANVTNMTCMFADCNEIPSIDVSHFNTANVTDMSNMFQSCYKLASVDVSNFNTANVTTMASMFISCYEFTSLDLSSFNTANVTNMGYMFAGNHQLSTIYVSSLWSTAAVTNSDNMFDGCTSLAGGAGTSFNTGHIDATYAHIDGGTSNPGYFTDINAPAAAQDGDPFTAMNVDGVLMSFRVLSAEDKTCEIYKGYEIAAIDTETSGVMNIPETVTDSIGRQYTVTRIGHYAFLHCKNITEVTTPSTVTSIGNNAFHDCASLTNYDLPAGVTELCDRTFYETYFKHIVIPANITTIMHESFGSSSAITVTSYIQEPFALGENAFGYSTQTATLYVPVGTIDAYKATDGWKDFYRIAEDTNIQFADNIVKDICVTNWDKNGDGELSMSEAGAVTSISSVFKKQSISSFDELQYFTGLQKIDDEAFSGCTQLSSVRLPETITEIGNAVFVDCPITSIEIPSSVTTIGRQAFIGTSLETLSIPNSVTSVGISAFNATNLKSITIPSTLTNIGHSAFLNYGLEQLVVESGNPVYDSRNDCNALIETSTNTLLTGCNNTVIPEDVTSIDSEAFRWMNNLTSITIPASVEHIGEYAFDVSSYLTTIVCEREYAIDAESNIFNNYSYQEATLYVPAVGIQSYNMTSPWNLFQHIEALGSSDQPETYAVLSEANSTNTNDNTASPASHRAVTAQPMVLTFYYDTKKAERGGMSVGPFSSAEERPWHEMSERIENVIFDSAVTNDTTITSTADWFYEFTNLKNIDGLQWLNTKNVTNMASMFSFCSTINWINLSNLNTSKVTDMDFMFIGCSGLTSLDLSNFNTTNVTSMHNMFMGCSSLTSLDLSNFNTTNVTGMNAMFFDCSGLTSLDLSNFNTVNTTEMHSMFTNCSSLTTIYAGSGWNTTAETMGKDMFKGCTSLVGGKGTTYDENHVDATYAHIDGGTSNPGYFTDKWGDRKLVQWRQVGGKEYRLYKASNKNDFRTNADGWNMYRTRLTLDIISGTDTTTTVVDDGSIYCEQNLFSNAMTQCMMIDVENNKMYVFANSKTDARDYSMDGYVYISPIEQPSFTKETVFTDANWGWFSYFRGVENGQPLLSHFSYMGYYDELSKRNADGTWSTDTEDSPIASPSNRESNWLVTRKFTVVGDTSSDEVTLDGVTYTVRSGGNAWVTWLDNGTYVESLTIPESVTADGRTLTVNGLAPLSCYTLTRLQSLELPSTVDMLGESVLVRCGNLRSLTVNRNQPPTLVLDNGALRQFTDIDSVNCELRVPYGSKALYESANGWRKFQNIVEMNAPTDDSDIIQFADAKVKVICVANWDTDGDGELSKAEAASVTSLGGVFNRDKDITSFDEFQYFTSVKVIGQNEFMDCNGLTSIILPNSIESIEREAFYNCRIQEITIPAGVTSISYAGLYGCFSNIYVEPANQYYTSVDGVLFNKDLTTIMCYPRLRNEESYTVPSSVTVIGGCAFYSSSLSTVIIPNGVTRFEVGAFRYCRQLKSIEIPETVELIESENFEGCNSLTSVFVPASVSSMAGDVFSGCTSLKEIIVDQNNPAYASVDGILYNKDLTRLCIYPGGRPDEKFEIPESVSTISYSAFISVSTLQAIVIPKNVTQIGRFSYCSQLKSVTVYWPEPLSISDNVFGDITLTEGTLYVPYGTKTRYEAADGWKQFQNIVEMDATIDYTFDYNGVLTVRGETTMADALSAAGGTEEVAKTITAVVWAKGTPLTNSDLQGLDNPNMLVYVADASLAPSNRDNVVIGNDSTGYLAKNIMLTDVESGNNNFYCPQEFTAEMISYTRNFRQQTEVGVSRGWETIALPFQVQTIMHEKNGLLAPFGNTSSDKHFWLRQIAMDGATTGLSAATQILPNTPYLISMPNSEEYPAEYNQNGRVTFSSQNVRVPNTEPSYAQTNIPSVGMVMFVPTFSAQTANNHIYALNVLEQRGEHKEGSIFEANYRVVRPFEAYTYHEDGQRPAPRYISIGDINSGTTGIEEVRWQMSDGRSDKWYTIDGRRLQQKPTQKGVYILNGRKTIVK